MDATALILCSGSEPTWDGPTPRHLLPVAGEPLLTRTMRICRELGHEAIAVCDKPYLKEAAGSGRWFDPGPNRWIYDTIRATKGLWGNQAVFLVGDVVFYHELLEKMFATEESCVWVGSFGVMALVLTRDRFGDVDRWLNEAWNKAERDGHDALQALQPLVKCVREDLRRDAFDLDHLFQWSAFLETWPWATGADPEDSGPTLVLLAAGNGDRLGRNKSLLEFGGKTLLARAVDLFAACGVRKAIVVVGHNADGVRESLGTSRDRAHIGYVENPAWASTKTGDSLLAARACWEGQPFFCLSADHVFDADFAAGAVVGGHGMAECMAMIDWRSFPVSGDETTVVPGGSLLAGTDAYRLAFPAVPGAYLSPELFSFTPKAGCLLPGLLAGRDVYEVVNAMGGALVPVKGNWIEIDTPEDLARAREMFGE